MKKPTPAPAAIAADGARVAMDATGVNTPPIAEPPPVPAPTVEPAPVPEPAPERDAEQTRKVVADARQVADAFTRGATPIVKVVASRDRWRTGRFWPRGETLLTTADCETLGRERFEQLRADGVFTIVPLDAD